jgi:flavin reductase (DIM6/NTAB) family NADH-FMN oxidoreductase RutF
MEEPELRDALEAFLTGGRPAVLATADRSGVPHTSLVTWLVARDARTVALALDRRSQHFRNLQENPRACLEVLGDGLVAKAAGRARVAREQMNSAPFPCAAVEVELEEVRDHSVPGVVFRGPSYSYAPGKEHRHGVEAAVLGELRVLEGRA